jgi:hypothetical protein
MVADVLSVSEQRSWKRSNSAVEGSSCRITLPFSSVSLLDAEWYEEDKDKDSS